MNHSKKNRHNYCDDNDALAEFVIRPQVDLNRRPNSFCTICAESQIKMTEVCQHSLTVLSRCTRKIDVWILCVTIAKTFDAIVVSKALCDRDRIRTCKPLIRRQMPYPLDHTSLCTEGGDNRINSVFQRACFCTSVWRVVRHESLRGHLSFQDEVSSRRRAGWLGMGRTGDSLDHELPPRSGGRIPTGRIPRRE